MSITKTLAVLLLLFGLTGTGGCSEYWWSRGKAKTPEMLLAAGRERLAGIQANPPYVRSDIAQSVADIRCSLEMAVADVETSQDDGTAAAELIGFREDFRKLEGKLSIGSRAAYGELSGQLRGMITAAEKGQRPEKEAFALYASRVMFFLADELAVPMPLIQG